MTIHLQSLSFLLPLSSAALLLCHGLLYDLVFSHRHPYQRRSRLLVYHASGSRQLLSQCRLENKKPAVSYRDSKSLLKYGNLLLSREDRLELPEFDLEVPKQLLSVHLLLLLLLCLHRI